MIKDCPYKKSISTQYAENESVKKTLTMPGETSQVTDKQLLEMWTKDRDDMVRKRKYFEKLRKR